LFIDPCRLAVLQRCTATAEPYSRGRGRPVCMAEARPKSPWLRCPSNPFRRFTYTAVRFRRFTYTAVRFSVCLCLLLPLPLPKKSRYIREQWRMSFPRRKHVAPPAATVRGCGGSRVRSSERATRIRQTKAITKRAMIRASR
jgi:hypothetical protein